jgi:hypothetical protein
MYLEQAVTLAAVFGKLQREGLLNQRRREAQASVPSSVQSAVWTCGCVNVQALFAMDRLQSRLGQ